MTLLHERSQALGKTINRFWRVLATGFCFVLFGVGSFLLSLIWFRLLFLVIRNPAERQRRARSSISACFRFFLEVARGIGALDYQIKGAEKLRTDQGCLILANHPTLIDYVLITSLLPHADCIVKAGLLNNFFLSGAVKSAGYLINSEGNLLVSACSERLAAGGVIVIFPEGTRTEPDQQPRLQRGAANIAVRVPCDMRLIQISCTETLLSKKSKWYKVPPQKPVFKIDVLDRVSPKPFLEQAQGVPSLAARRLTASLTQSLTFDRQT
ncbi:MAG: 1-acyl-sn-glycerol-3-phosphate acyltransferase [Marinospirillum sp.]|uniref:lysophospholipid acyltransferase family protein n=1 Tax=Marinospirillum sp. TaxID=2183934 RepID=UPI001A038A9E|nr:lysophospholipid acyltransferase family protein [Marinospirillum sp.]MBE0506873.1 1-acyl-sn-glycerol-3-phosphate acyltransferase [Marinospirillum sp.]